MQSQGFQLQSTWTTRTSALNGLNTNHDMFFSIYFIFLFYLFLSFWGATTKQSFPHDRNGVVTLYHRGGQDWSISGSSTVRKSETNSSSLSSVYR